MTQDETIEMVMQIGGCDRPEDDSPALKMFVAFAKLVEAKEREACATMSDWILKEGGGTWGDAIRARGQE